MRDIGLKVELTESEKMRYNNFDKSGFESMLGRFNRMIQTSGIMRELKDKEYFEKPSDKKRRKWHENEIKRNKDAENDRKYPIK